MIRHILIAVCFMSVFSKHQVMATSDKEFNGHFYNFHCVGHYYNACVRNGSRDPNITTTIHGPSFEDSIKFLFVSRIQQGEFNKAFGIFERLREKSAEQIVEAIIKTAYDNAQINFSAFAHNYTKITFETYLRTNEFGKAHAMASAYLCFNPPVMAAGWVNQTKQKLLEKLDSLAVECKIIGIFDANLSQKKEQEALALISLMPTSLQNELTRHYQQKKNNFVPPQSNSVNSLVFERRLADKLFE